MLNIWQRLACQPRLIHSNCIKHRQCDVQIYGVESFKPIAKSSVPNVRCCVKPVILRSREPCTLTQYNLRVVNLSIIAPYQHVLA